MLQERIREQPPRSQENSKQKKSDIVDVEAGGHDVEGRLSLVNPDEIDKKPVAVKFAGALAVPFLVLIW